MLQGIRTPPVGRQKAMRNYFRTQLQSAVISPTIVLVLERDPSNQPAAEPFVPLRSYF